MSSSLEDTIAILKKHKDYLAEVYGVTRLGIFGSFVRGEQTSTSDIDVVIEMKKEKKSPQFSTA